MVQRGDLERIHRGIYRRRGAPSSELETLATVSKRIPGAVICLLTALHVHGIGTQAPRQVWIAIDWKARKPAVPSLPIRVVRFSKPIPRSMVEIREILGVSVVLTSPVRTVVDCFRYRRKIGVDVALEALRDAITSRKASIAEIARLARRCRISTVMAPYLEAMSS